MRWKAQNIPNVGLIFYKERYFGKRSELNPKGEIEIQDGFEEDNKETLSADLNYYKNFGLDNFPHSFSLKTTYPGLLVGSGYPHDTNTEGDFAIGFYFDYTSGLPVIPGSSVKGICRSLFELDQKTINGDIKKFSGIDSLRAIRFILDEMNSCAPNMHINIIDKLKCKIEEEINDISSTRIDKSIILKELIDNLFGDQDRPGQDVFLDAIIDIPKTGNRPFLGDDYITPHPSPIKNPKPIQFLKVLPNIWFKFRFILFETRIKISDSEDLILTPEFKLDFYKQILLTLGVGAKTSVGYGRLEDEHRCEQVKKNDQSEPNNWTVNPSNIQNASSEPVSQKIRTNNIKQLGKLKNGEEIIIEFNTEKPNSALFIALDESNNHEITIEAKLVGNKPSESGLYKAQISNIEGKGTKRKFIVKISNFNKLA